MPNIPQSGKEWWVCRSVTKQWWEYTITITEPKNIERSIFTYTSYLKETLDSQINTDNVYYIAARLLAMYRKKSKNKRHQNTATAAVTIGLFLEKWEHEKILEPLSYLVTWIDESLLEALKQEFAKENLALSD